MRNTYCWGIWTSDGGYFCVDARSHAQATKAGRAAWKEWPGKPLGAAGYLKGHCYDPIGVVCRHGPDRGRVRDAL
jgi:hypothetical protein